MRTSHEQPLSRTLNQLLRSLHHDRPATPVPPDLHLRWQSCVGSFMAERTRLLGFYKGTLRIGAKDTQTLNTLLALDQEIIERLKPYGPPTVHAIAAHVIPKWTSTHRDDTPLPIQDMRTDFQQKDIIDLSRAKSKNEHLTEPIPKTASPFSLKDPLLHDVRPELRPAFERLLALHRASAATRTRFRDEEAPPLRKQGE